MLSHTRGWVAATVVGLACALLSAGGIASAGTDDYPHWPMAQFNHRGENVRALQYLLTQAGYPALADGIFGSTTKANVMAFQQTHPPVDGYVGSGTWSALAITVAQGDQNYAVRAVQSLLNAKRDPYNPAWDSVTVDGIFGQNTAEAVRDFQEHMGLSRSGVVNQQTWKRLLWHYQLMGADSYVCMPPPYVHYESWGTAATDAALYRAGYYYAEQVWGDLPVWDLSHEHGEAFPEVEHGSHDRGMDVDVGIITKNPIDQCTTGRGITYQQTTRYSQAKTQAMVWDLRQGAAFSSIQMIKLIYYNDPLFQVWFPTLVQPWEFHDNHLHVRYCVFSHYDLDYSECSS